MSSNGQLASTPAARSLFQPALLVLLLAVLASLPFLVSSDYDTRGDASLYIATARSMLSGEGYSYMGIPFIVRPPGFSAMLMPVLAGWGTNFFALNLYIEFYGVLAVVLLYFYLQPRLGDWLSAAVAIAVWFNPGFQQLTNRVLGDVPGLAALLAILLLERWSRDTPSLGRHLLLGVAIGMACHLRSALILLIPAILLARALAPGGPPAGASAWRDLLLRQVAPLVLLPILILIPWSLRNAAQSPPSPAEELKLHSYAVAQWHEDVGDPTSRRLGWGEVGSRVPKRALQVLPVLGSRMYLPRTHKKRNRILGGLALSCWLVVLLRRREAAEFFVGGLLAVLLLYFGFVDRLALPIYALVFGNVVEVLLWGARTLARQEAARAFCAAAVLGLATLDFEPHFQWEKIAREQADHLRVSEHLNRSYPPGTPLASLNGAHLMVYAERPVHALRWALQRDGVERAAEIVAEKGAAAAVVGREGPLNRYFRQRYPVDLQTDTMVVYRIE